MSEIKMPETKMSKTRTFFERLIELLGLAGGFPAIFGTLGKIWKELPEEAQKHIKQQMPGFLGLSLKDEAIFNSLIGRLTNEDQWVIMKFLYEKCKDFQRNRFINIVGGMEVIQGTPTILEKKWDEKTKKFDEKTTPSRETIDLRLNFLKKFAKFIHKYGPDKAYKMCIGGRMVLENPFHQQVIKKWKESVEWFEETVMIIFGVSSIREMRDKISQGIGTAATAIEAKTASMPKYNGHLRGIFGDKIGGFFEKTFC